MKTFSDIRERRSPQTLDQEIDSNSAKPSSAELNEANLLRKGAGLVYARQSKQFGDKAAQSFRSARQRFQIRPNESIEDRIENLSEGLKDLSKGLEDLRNQNGSITALTLASVLLSEKQRGRR